MTTITISGTTPDIYLSLESAKLVRDMRDRVAIMREIFMRNGHSKELFDFALTNKYFSTLTVSI